MFALGRPPFLHMVAFLCLFSGVSQLSVSAIPSLEQSVLAFFGLGTRWLATKAGAAGVDALPQEIREPLSDIAHACAYYAQAAVACVAQKEVLGEELAQSVVESTKSLIDAGKDLAIDVTPILLGINIAIILWTGALVTYEKIRTRFNGLDLKISSQGSSAAGKELALAHQSGMDAYWFGMTLLSAYVAFEKISQIQDARYALSDSKESLNCESVSVRQVESVESFANFVQDATICNADYVQSTATGIAGLIIGYVAFTLIGFPVAIKVTNGLNDNSFIKRMFKDSLFVALVFDIGIVLAAAAKRILFSVGEYTGLLAGCSACQETYQAGEDAAYVISDVLSNWKNFIFPSLAKHVKAE